MKKQFLKGNNRDIPTLYWDMVFVESTQPILFSCVDNKGKRYICTCHCADGEKSEWIAAPTTCEKLIGLLTDKITIRNIFDTCEEPVLLVTLRAGADEPEVRTISLGDIPPKHLPTAGYYMEADDGEFAQELAELKSAAELITLTEEARCYFVSYCVKDIPIYIPPVKGIGKEYRKGGAKRLKVAVSW